MCQKLTKCLPGKHIAVDLGSPVRAILTSPARRGTTEDPLSIPLENVVAGLLAQLLQSPGQVQICRLYNESA